MLNDRMYIGVDGRPQSRWSTAAVVKGGQADHMVAAANLAVVLVVLVSDMARRAGRRYPRPRPQARRKAHDQQRQQHEHDASEHGTLGGAGGWGSEDAAVKDPERGPPPHGDKSPRTKSKHKHGRDETE